MKDLHKILFLLIALLLTKASSGQEISCRLTGQIIGRESNALILFRATEDPDHDTMTFIPINDGKFEYTLTASFPEAYFLIFQDDLELGNYRYIYFFPENGTTDFKLYSKADVDKDEIIGGKLTSEYYNYFKLNKYAYWPQKKAILDSIAELEKREEYYNSEFKIQQKKLTEVMAMSMAENCIENDHEIAIAQTQVVQNMINKKEHVTQKGRALNDKMDSISVLENRHRIDYIQNNPSLVSYYFLIQDTQDIEFRQGVTESDIKLIAPIFSEKYPDHPYTKMMAMMLESLLRIKVSEKYIDFSAPDLNGKYYKLSEIIDGKFAVIDLWASWCGPCINGSRSLVPIYEEFKEKGFTICGIAREYKNTDALKYRLEKEKFPWINLVEMDDKNQIWLQYSVQGAGRKFLVDDKGEILAIEPEAEEIRKILSERLNQ
jgi:thiol-disulfide isomerase/thioredoxin